MDTVDNATVSVTASEQDHGELGKIIGHVTGINLFPIKSCRGIHIDRADTTFEGLVSPGQASIKDRHFMLIQPSGSTHHQRLDPNMALIVPSVRDGALEISAPGMDNIIVPVPTNKSLSELKQCNVWKEPIGGADCGDEAAEWFSGYLKKPVRLVYAVEGQNRRRTDERGNTKDKIAYQDDMPFQLLGEASIRDLNTRLQEKVTTGHFRANIEVDTTVPYVEDHVKKVKIGTAEFTNIKQTPRCLMTTVNPITGIQSSSGEPLKTMRSYRIFPEVDLHSPCMGTFLVANNEGTFSVGDPVYAH